VNVDTLGRQNLRQVSRLHRAPIRGWSSGTKTWLRSPTLGISLVIGLATFILRLSYAASKPTDPNGLSLVRGSLHFDVSRGNPVAPGSWLYVAAGHAIHVVSGLSSVSSLVLLAALASAGAAGLTCVAGTALGGRWIGIAAGGLVASAPVSWFAGSVVSTYSFDAFLAALLVILARRARPYRAHGVAAVFALGLGAGFQLSVVAFFIVLAAIAVMASVRTVGQLLSVAAAAVGSVAIWFVPMIVIQPGGLHAWFHALHVQISTASHTSSVFAASSSGVVTNIGTFGGWSLVSLGPTLAVAVVAVVVLAVARLVTGHRGGNVALRIWSSTSEQREAVDLPRYQTTGAVLGAALIPPIAVVTLGRFSGGGAVLGYLVPATVLLLLPVARLLHHRNWGLRRTTAVVASLLLVGAVAVNVQRFVAAPGILPTSVIRQHPSLWISQTRYQAPYAETAAAIRAADRRSAQAGRPELHP
jgi:hypothetical protein